MRGRNSAYHPVHGDTSQKGLLSTFEQLATEREKNTGLDTLETGRKIPEYLGEVSP
jgi:hypothetical protein